MQPMQCKHRQEWIRTTEGAQQHPPCVGFYSAGTTTTTTSSSTPITYQINELLRVLVLNDSVSSPFAAKAAAAAELCRLAEVHYPVWSIIGATGIAKAAAAALHKLHSTLDDLNVGIVSELSIRYLVGVLSTLHNNSSSSAAAAIIAPVAVTALSHLCLQGAAVADPSLTHHAADITQALLQHLTPATAAQAAAALGDLACCASSALSDPSLQVIPQLVQLLVSPANIQKAGPAADAAAAAVAAAEALHKLSAQPGAADVMAAAPADTNGAIRRLVGLLRLSECSTWHDIPGPAFPAAYAAACALTSIAMHCICDSTRSALIAALAGAVGSRIVALLDTSPSVVPNCKAQLALLQGAVALFKGSNTPSGIGSKAVQAPAAAAAQGSLAASLAVLLRAPPAAAASADALGQPKLQQRQEQHKEQGHHQQDREQKGQPVAKQQDMGQQAQQQQLQMKHSMKRPADGDQLQQQLAAGDSPQQRNGFLPSKKPCIDDRRPASTQKTQQPQQQQPATKNGLMVQHTPPPRPLMVAAPLLPPPRSIDVPKPTAGAPGAATPLNVLRDQQQQTPARQQAAAAPGHVGCVTGVLKPAVQLALPALEKPGQPRQLPVTGGHASKAAAQPAGQEPLRDSQQQGQLGKHSQQKQKQPDQAQQQQGGVSPVAVAAVAAAAALGPAAIMVVKQELGAVPCQQQLQYWQLADEPFNPQELKQLTHHYMQLSLITDEPMYVVEQHYPALAPVLLQLHAEVEAAQRKQHMGSAVVAYAASSAGMAADAAAAGVAGEDAASPAAAAVQLLRALRCLRLWEQRQVAEPDMPNMLQRMVAAHRLRQQQERAAAQQHAKGSAAAAAAAEAAGAAGGLGSTGAAAASEGDECEVQEVLDLTGDDDDDDDDDALGDGGGWVQAEQEHQLLSGACEVVMVREVAGRQQPGPGCGLRIKPEVGV